VVVAAEGRDLEIPDASGFSSTTGQGVTAPIAGGGVAVGKPGWLAAHGAELAPVADRIEAMLRRAR
jgi:cation transport ATPase